MSSGPLLPDVIKLSPSGLTFDWESCKRCYWLAARGVLKRPSGAFPRIFTVIDGLMKDHYFNVPTNEMAEGLPPGRVSVGDRWVRSCPIEVRGHETRIAIAGKIDTALSFADGSYGVIDYKTSQPRREHIDFYSRQLHAYALALEQPAEGALELSPISLLGLLCVEPVAMVALGDNVALKGETTFLPIERDDQAFLTFLSQVLYVLERSEPPDPDPKCSYCKYVAVGAVQMLTGLYEV
jgi:CRISPR/Cas system-associated exonuclease Cas4 (RecB family)